MKVKVSLQILVVMFSAILTITPALASEPEPLTKLVKQSLSTLKNFMADPDMGWVRSNIKKAKGVMIIPRQLSGAFILGAEGGSGVLLAQNKDNNWSYPAFYTMGSLSFGLQAGGKVSEVILLIMTEKGIDALLSSDIKLGADLSVAAGPIGAGAELQTADVIAFARSKGAYGGVSLTGAVITPRDKWNERYYGKPARAIDVIVKQNVTNHDADTLVKTLKNAAEN